MVSEEWHERIVVCLFGWLVGWLVATLHVEEDFKEAVIIVRSSDVREDSLQFLDRAVLLERVRTLLRPLKHVHRR